MKRILIALVLVLAALLAVLSYSIWQNNQTIREVGQDDIKLSLDKSIEWLVSNRTRILQRNNRILWWMINESALITNDERLVRLSGEYKRTMKTRYANFVWNYLIDDKFNLPMDKKFIATRPYYIKFILYGLSCSEELLSLEAIKIQNDVNFCWESHPASPTCITHQLMGFRFMQRRNCLNDQLLANKIATLQKYILWQIFLDFRVVDVYLQRVLMLADSGLKKEIKPIWLKRIIEAQLKDGGWGDFHGLISVGKHKYFGFWGHRLTVSRPKSKFHTTAQGVYLMSLMQN